MIKTLPMNHMDMEHKWSRNRPKPPQNYIVHPMLVPVVSYFISYPAFKCLQYHSMPQTCVWTVIDDQNPTYEPYGYGAQKVQKRAKNTSNLHRSSRSCARSITFYVVLIIQMHTIPIQPQTCVWTVIGDENSTYEPYGYCTINGAKTGQKYLKCSSFIPFLCTYYHFLCRYYHSNAYNTNPSPKHVCER